MRILVDHSGYALLNIGDVAMLQACVHRLHELWPLADIDVFTESPERLQQYCPNARPVATSIVGRKGASALPMSVQLGAEQICKTAMPFFARSGFSARRDGSGTPRLLKTIRDADIVVASGGGYVNDPFWWHGAGVLSVLAMAQRLGKPTAMFGQGLGPLTNRVVVRLARRIMPRLDVIGLREGMESVPVLQRLGVELDGVAVTGDDALHLATPASRPPTGSAIGVNVRVATYSGVGSGSADRVVAGVRGACRRYGTDLVPVPVSRYAATPDLDVLHIAPQNTHDHAGVGEIDSPTGLARQIANCRVVVTGSYHAAVFALAAGIPAVCLTNSSYYDTKFRGLARQFPVGCQVMRIDSDFEDEMAERIAVAWDTSEEDRAVIHQLALAQVRIADELYERFRSMANARYATPSSGQQLGGPRPRRTARANVNFTAEELL